MSYVYGVFVGSRWAMETNRRRAERWARRQGGYVVRNRYEPPSREDRRRGLVRGWDAHTFEALGEKIADYSALDYRQRILILKDGQ